MSGHSKWHSIKHKKAATDAKRGKIFTKLIREITIAARDGGGDTDTNPRLRLVLANAKSENMPKDTIEIAIKKGTGELESDTLIETTYEGYGPGGGAVLVEVLTDNKNRAVSEIRRAFSKFGGNLGESKSISSYAGLLLSGLISTVINGAKIAHKVNKSIINTPKTAVLFLIKLRKILRHKLVGLRFKLIVKLSDFVSFIRNVSLGLNSHKLCLLIN